METLQTVVLAVVQGITEFLPVSSSAHLILVPELLGWAESGLAFDVAVHVGTLFAVIVFLKDEILKIVPAWFAGWSGLAWSNEGLLGWMIVVATIPLGLVGLLFQDYIELNLRTSAVIAASTLIFGLLLGWSDRKGATNTLDDSAMTFNHAWLIGLSQVFALIPGTSRSGVTMSALLMLGYSRVASARFSFLLAIPAIALPGILKTAGLITQSAEVDWSSLLLGVAVSAFFAFLTMHWFIALITKVGLMPFVIYRIALAALIFLVLV